MRDSHDKLTLTIGELPKLRGRPSTGKAMTAAERQKAHRAKKQQEKNEQLRQMANAYDWMDTCQLARGLEGLISVSIPGDRQSLPALEEAKLAWLEIGRRNGWL